MRIIADRSERCSWPPAVKILVPSARSPYLFPRVIHVQGYVSRQRWCVSPIRHLVHPRTEPNLPSRRTAWIRSVTSLCRPLSIGPEPTRSSTPLTASPDPHTTGIRLPRVPQGPQGCRSRDLRARPEGEAPSDVSTHAARITPRADITRANRFPPSPLFPASHLPACLLYTSPSPRDATLSRMPSSA